MTSPFSLRKKVRQMGLDAVSILLSMLYMLFYGVKTIYCAMHEELRSVIWNFGLLVVFMFVLLLKAA